MRLWYTVLALAIIILLLLSGCRAAPPQGGITDDLGRNIKVKGIPQRIISLSPGNTEIVYALGLEDRLVGVTSYCNYPPEVKEKPVVSEFSDIDIEKVVSLEPDLILADSLHKAAVIPALEKLGITVLAIDPATVDGIIRDIEILGQITGAGGTEDLISNLRQRINRITQKTDSLPESERPRLFFLSWHDPLWTAGSGTLINDILRKAGGVNIAEDLTGHVQISLESVIQRNPKIIFVLSSMGDQNTSLDYILGEPRFQATEALKSGRVYPVDSDIFSRTTPRSVDGLEKMAKIVHPELFD